MHTKNYQDSAWKEILDAYLKDFMDYCLSHLSQLIDWNKGWVPLDKELHSIFKHLKKSKQIVDKLFKVHLKNGEERFILIHVEVQGKKEINFSERMLSYDCLMYHKYKCPLISCVILTDTQRDWCPNQHHVGLDEFGLSVKFPIIKIIDYVSRKEELEASNNPFACVILSQLIVLQNQRKPDEERKLIKLDITRRLFKKGYSKQTIHNLYCFIDWLIGLPENLEIQYIDEVHKLEEVYNMSYVTSAERIGMKRGIQIGVEQGIGKVARNLLANNMDIDFVKKVTHLTFKQIKDLEKELQESVKE